MKFNKETFRALKSPLTQIGLLPCLIGVLLCLYGCSSSANIDETWIRGHYRIPEGTKLLRRVSDPEHAGTFGREGLIIQAEFEFTEEQLKDFSQRVQLETTWNKLPIAELLYLQLAEVDRFHKVDLKKFDSIKNGYYTCETTARMGLLSQPKTGQTTFFRYPPNTPDKDYALAVLDSDKKILYVVLQQDY